MFENVFNSIIVKYKHSRNGSIQRGVDEMGSRQSGNKLIVHLSVSEESSGKYVCVIYTPLHPTFI